MLPINMRELKKMLKKYGIEVQELPEVRTVTLSADSYDLILKNPQVAILNLGQQKVVQIICSGIERIEKSTAGQAIPSVSEDDISFIMEQTGASREEVLKALSEVDGDIAKAILRLQERRSSI